MAVTPLHSESVSATPVAHQAAPQSAWELALRDLREAEALGAAISARFPDGDPLASAAVSVAVDAIDGARGELLKVPAPDAAALAIKIEAFLEREGDMLPGIVGEELASVFADVRRLLAL